MTKMAVELVDEKIREIGAKDRVGRRK